MKLGGSGHSVSADELRKFAGVKCKVGRVVCRRNSMEASMSGAAPQNQVGGTGLGPEARPDM